VATVDIACRGVSMVFGTGGGAVAALGDVTLDVARGEFAALIGPSGCGKSTVLRMINRLIEPTGGVIRLDGEDVTRTDPVALRRRIGYVIQNVGLFPHHTVRANIGTVPWLLGWNRRRIPERADELLELVGLEPAQYGNRYPHELSGGQRQRVGVARALAADPVVLLMDEPFSAVDPIARGRLQEEFRRLQARVRKTIVLVTHDLDEAIRLADRVAVLGPGAALHQYAAPAELLRSPANEFVAEFVGADRGIKRLAVTRIDPATLPSPDPVDLSGGHPTVPVRASLHDALALLLEGGTGRVLVVDDGGTPVGVLGLDHIWRTFSEVPAA